MLDDEKVLAFVPAENEKKADATGALQPEATAFVRWAKAGAVVHVDNRASFPQRRKQVLEAMVRSAGQGFTSVAFFCHGWSSGIQLGFRNPHVTVLAQAIVSLTGRADVRVPLYCCSTGADTEGDEPSTPAWGEGSFADRLRDALCAASAQQCRVLAHTTPGHTTRNPHVVFFDGMGVPSGGVGGFAPVAPRSALWKRWRAALRAPEGGLRFRAPYLSPREIHAELGAVA